MAYAIGVAEPVGVFVNTYGTSKVFLSDGEIAAKIGEICDLRPFAIIRRFGLKNPIYQRTATYGHFGRSTLKESIEVSYQDEHTTSKEIDGKIRHFKEVEYFGWEKLDCVDQFREAFGLSNQ